MILVSSLPHESSCEDSQHSGSFSTLNRIASEIKQVRKKYRKALDFGKQGGAC